MGADHSQRLRLTHQVEHDGLAGGLFTTRVLERGDRELRRDGWATSARELPPLGQPLFRTSVEGEWLSARGAPDGAGGSMTLAELYARAEGRDASETRLVGFGDDGR